MKRSKILAAIVIFGLFGLAHANQTTHQVIATNIPIQSTLLPLITALGLAKMSPSNLVRAASIAAGATCSYWEYLKYSRK